MSERLTCACCGYRTLAGSRGGYEICPICCWEDDPDQINDPHSRSGVNAVSLVEAQRAFQTYGWSDKALADRVRSIDLFYDVRDPAWRPYVDALDAAEPRGREHFDWPRVYWLDPVKTVFP